MLGHSDSLAIHVCALRDPLPSNGIIIGEAETVDTLQQWASHCDDSTLAAGAAEFFGACLETTRNGGARSAPKPEGALERGQELFVSGTASESSRAFLAESRRRGVPVFYLSEDLAYGADFSPAAGERLAQRVATALKSSPRVILGIGLPPASDPRLAEQLPAHLTQVAEMILARANVRHVFAEGGATAAALVHRMGWTRLKVLRELAPGVVTLGLAAREHCTLTLKPGSYAWPKEVCESLDSDARHR